MKSTTINVNKIPTEIKYDGKEGNAVEQIDTKGKNIVVVTETGIIESKSGDDNKSASLFAAHYIFSKNSYALTWKINDFVKGTCVIKSNSCNLFLTKSKPILLVS